MTGGAWSRFLDYAARARSKPAFDVEEREWKLEVASAIRSVLAGHAEGGDWPERLVGPVNRSRLPFVLSTYARRQLRRWATSEPDSLRSALAGFSDASLDPIERFARFADEAERSRFGNSGEQEAADQSSIVAIGAVFNFASAPERLPLVRPSAFWGLAELTGETVDVGDGSTVALYRWALEFALRVRRKLEAAGVPIRDMIDVQGLIDTCVYEADMWTADPPPDWFERAHRPLPEGTAYLAVCALFRNEAPYLREWIEFHRLVGVDRFFLYDNASSDDYLDVLAPYLDEQVVVLHEWPAPAPDQREVFDDCLRIHRDDARWIAFIDLDEFLFSPTGETLDRLLPDFERWPGVGVEWAMFSLSGGREKPGDLVIDSYPFRDAYDQRLVKLIVDPLRTVRCLGAHWFEFEHGLPADENGWPLAFPASKATAFARLRINHYASRSEQEALAKTTRQSGWTHMRRWRERDLRGELELVSDDAIARWVPPLRAALEQSRALR
jgi:Glycosyltransferase family 92